MIFCNLGSGSRGNSSYIKSGNTSILIDQGFSGKELCSRMQRVGLHPDTIDALVLTHDHSDHYKGIGVFARKFKVPVFLTQLTQRRLSDRILKKVETRYFTAGDEFMIGDINLKSFHIPHDAEDPIGFIISGNEKNIAHLTDIGHPVQSVIHQLKDYSFDLVFLESNHDPVMLKNGPYPLKVQMRIKSRDGHLSNGQSLELLTNLNQNGNMRHLILGHLSEENNHRDLVEKVFTQFKLENGHSFKIAIASQTTPTDIIQL